MKTPDQVNIPEVVNENALDIFQPKRLDLLLTQVETEVNSLVGLDPSNPRDYKHMGTVAARVSSFKVAIEKMGKALVDPIKAQAKEVDLLRKMNKDRMEALRENFLAPRVAYDAEVEAHAKAVAAAFELFQFGHSKVVEFGQPTIKDFDAQLAKMESVEMTESFFGDRLKDAQAARESGVHLLEMRRKQFLEDELIREAGRKALQAQQDAEAAQRHAEREAQRKADNPHSAETLTKLAGSKEAAIDAIEKAKIHNGIVSDLVKNEICSEAAAKELIRAIYRGKIANLEIKYA